MGWVIWRSKSAANEPTNALPIRQQVVFASTVSLLNPHAILDTVGVIGTSALKYSGTEQLFFTLACIAVSWIWFFGLTFVGAVMTKLDGTGSIMTVFQKSSALFIWATAIYLFTGLI